MFLGFFSKVLRWLSPSNLTRFCIEKSLNRVFTISHIQLQFLNWAYKYTLGCSNLQKKTTKKVDFETFIRWEKQAILKNSKHPSLSNKCLENFRDSPRSSELFWQIRNMTPAQSVEITVTRTFLVQVYIMSPCHKSEHDGWCFTEKETKTPKMFSP